MIAAEAIAALAAGCGLADLTLDSADECELVFDGDLSIVLYGPPQGQTLEVSATVGGIGAAGAVERTLLELNFASVAAGEGWLALDPIAGNIVVRDRIDTGALSGEGVVARVNAIYQAARRWRDQLPDMTRTPGQAEIPHEDDFEILRL